MKATLMFATLLFASLSMSTAFAHCEVPCGIYGDNMRFAALLEDVATIKKSVTEFNKETTAKKMNYNQLVRWVKNKDKYADKINQTMLTYFLTQRVKTTAENYTEQLKAVHKIILLAVKVKQTANQATVTELEKAIKAFQVLYNAKTKNK